MSEPHKLIRAFELQAFYCRDLGSPFMGNACEIFAEHFTADTKIGKTLFDWPGKVDAGGSSLPLRLLGCLHRLVLSGESPELAQIYPPHKLSSKDWPVFEKALAEHGDTIRDQLQSAPQTNEVRRSGVMLPGFIEIASQAGALPFIMSELGASAGLNMHWDKFGYKLGDNTWGDADAAINLDPKWTGPELKIQKLHVADRAGCDLNPIDLGNNQTVETLLSYLWADQPERIARTRAAIEIFNRSPARIDKMGAIDWLKLRLAEPYENHIHVIYHTIAWQYFSDKDKQQGEALIAEAGAKATKTSPLAWLRFEADGQQPGAALTLRLWPGGEEQFLGRADYHGRWIDWAG